MLIPKDDGQGGPNHPLAWRMCAIAFVSYNLVLGCMMGTYGLLLPAVEEKLNVARGLTSLGVPIVFLGLSVTAPIIGTLVQKYSLRRMMMLGTMMGLIGYVVLALSTSFWINLVAYALLFGPSVSLGATVLPPTLVTRWFRTNRGRALGIASSTLLMAGIPPLAAKILGAYGLSATYFTLAGTMLVLLVPLSFVVDYPPDAMATGGAAASHQAADTGMSVGQLLLRGRFWALALASAAVISGATILSVHFVPMAEGWGIDPTSAATLVTVSSLAGMVGAILVGWLAERIGGAGAMVLLCIINGVTWGALLLQPSYGALMVVAALLGLFGASIVPAFGVALTQQFGAESFSRAFGLGMLVALPFNAGPVIMGKVYETTHSYANGLVGLVVLFIVATLLALSAVKRSPASVAVPAE